ncbi:MAG: SPOR domain-containing protein [Gammaproteobacteria bacterium]
MERQLLERMIGAGVLLVAFVVIVPAVLDGRPDEEDASDSGTVVADPPVSDAPRRQHTIHLDRPSDNPPVAREPAADPRPASADATATPPRTAAKARRASSAEGGRPTGPAPVAATVARVSEPEPKPKPELSPEPKTEPRARAPVAAAGWIVQLGSFSNRANAKGLADETRAGGFESYLMPVERAGRTLYRVRVGPARKTRGEAKKLADALRKAGFSGQVAEQSAGG